MENKSLYYLYLLIFLLSLLFLLIDIPYLLFIKKISFDNAGILEIGVCAVITFFGTISFLNMRRYKKIK